MIHLLYFYYDENLLRKIFSWNFKSQWKHNIFFQNENNKKKTFLKRVSCCEHFIPLYLCYFSNPFSEAKAVFVVVVWFWTETNPIIVLKIKLNKKESEEKLVKIVCHSHGSLQSILYFLCFRCLNTISNNFQQIYTLNTF